MYIDFWLKENSQISVCQEFTLSYQKECANAHTFSASSPEGNEIVTFYL